MIRIRPRTRRLENRPVRRFRRPLLELLEDRRLLAQVNWAVDADGYWDVAANWVDDLGIHRLPAAADDVSIDRKAGKFAVTVRNGGQAARSLIIAGDERLAITGGTLTVAVESELKDFTLSGGTLVANGTLTCSGSATWSGGTLAGSAGFVNAGTVTLDGPSAKYLGAAAALDNNGMILHRGAGPLTLAGNALLRNRPGGVYDFQSDANISWDQTGTASVLTNEGTLRKSIGSGVSVVSGDFRNEGGLIDVQAGRLELQSSGTSTGGTFTIATGATLDLTGGASPTYQGTYAGSGAGMIVLGSGTLHPGSGATFAFPAGLLQWTGGTIDGGTLTNEGSITLAGPGKKRLGGTAVLENNSEIRHGGGALWLEVGAALRNRPRGLYDFQGDANISWGQTGTAPVLTNEGTLRKSSGSGESVVSGDFRNEGGLIDVQAGRLELQSSGASTGGTFTVAAGTTLDLTGGASPTYQGRYTGSGAGTIVLADGTLQPGSGATFAFPEGLLQWTGGAIDGGTLTNEGGITLAGPADKRLGGTAVLENHGVVRHGDDGALWFEVGAAFRNRPSGLYDFQGNADLSWGQTGAAPVFTNEGTLRKSAGGGQSQIVPSLDNSGTVEVATGNLRVTKPVQHSGNTLTGGTWSVGPGAALAFPTGNDITTNQATVILAGSGSAFAKFNKLATNAGNFQLLDGRDFSTVGNLANSGTLVLGANSDLNVKGRFTNTGTVSVQIHDRPDTNRFGQLAVTGVAELAGTLHADLQRNLTLQLNDSFQVLTCASRTAEFASHTGLQLGGLHLDPVYTATDLRLAVLSTNAAPQVTQPIADVSVDEDAADRSVDLSAVFSDSDGDPLTLTVQANDDPNLVTAVLVGTDLTLDFLDNQHGVAHITIRATDPAGAFVDDTFLVTVASVNDVPAVAQPIANVYVNEDAADSVLDLAATFADADGDLLTLSVQANDKPSLVTAQLAGTNLALDFQADQFGVAYLTIRATDPSGAFVDDTFLVTVAAVNDRPRVANPIPDVQADEDAADRTLSLASTFSDPDGNPLTLSVQAIDNPSLVMATLAGKSLTLDFLPNQNGTAQITIRARDPAGAFQDDTFQVVVAAVNDSPTVARPAADVTVDENAPNTVLDLARVFSDVDTATNGDTLTLTVQANDNPSLVVVSLVNNTLTLDYQPDQSGLANVTIQATDTAGAWVRDAFVVRVTSTQHPPTLVTPLADVRVKEDARDRVINLAGTFTDPDRDALTLSVQANSNPGLISPRLSGTSLTLDFLDNQNGTADITVRATDPSGLFAEDTFGVTVTAVNDSPRVARPIVDVAVDENAPDTVLDLAAVFSDVDIATNRDQLTLAVQGNTSPGVVTATLAGTVLTLDYPKDRSGVSQITIRATDLAGAFATDAFQVTVRNVNVAPRVAKPITDVTVVEDAPNTQISLASVFTDGDGDALTLTVRSNSNPALVQATLSGVNLTLDYQANQHGAAQITVRATDPSGAFAEDVFQVTVTPGNEAPVARNDPGYRMVQDAGLQIDAAHGVLANDTDSDGDPLTALLVTRPAHGSLDLRPDGSFGYTPHVGFTGTDSFTYKAYDGQADSNVVTVTITVTPDPELIPQLVKDIRLGAAPGTVGSRFASFGNSVAFVADDGVHGWELWKSDGTAEGTVMVKDIRPGYAGSAPSGLVNINGTIFFSADDGVHGHELWTTDGTEAGTVLVKDIRPGSLSSGPGAFTSVNGTILFVADDGVHGFDLWQTDGTTSGTNMLKDICPGSCSSILVPWIAEANGSLFFPADDGVHGRELWKSDGTTAGTVMVRDINAPAAVRHEQPPAAWGTTTAYASTQCLVCKWGWQSFDDFTFASDTTITGVNWRGYYRHADARLNPGSPSTDYWNISFWSDSGAGPLIPVQSGTYPVASLQMTFAGYLPLEGGIGQVPVYDFHLDLQTPFVARGGRTYWFSPLSLAGRHPVEYVFGWMQAKAEPLVVQSSYQRDLQTSETFQRSVDLAFSLATHAPADIGSHPSHLTAVDNTLYFYADDGLHGSELWRSNGTPMSTTLVKDIRPGSPGSRPSAAYAAVDGKFVFPADDGVHDRELWVSDGTASGTTMVRDYDPGSGVPVWARVVEMDGAVFFAGYDAVHGAELWKTDGTQANTAMVKDITPGSAGTSYFEFLAKGHGKLFFLSDDGTHGYELWQTDGTEGGTRLVYDLWPGSRGSNPRTAAIYHDVLLFVAETESTGQELWKLKLARRDGVSRATEDAAPNGGDGNRDGTLDSLQANVTSLPNAVNAQYVTLESPGGTKLIDVAATKNPSPTNVPPGVSFPIGFLEYEVANVVPGGATTVTITVPTGATPTTYWKYGPIPGNLTPHWYEFLFDGTTGAQIMPGKIVLHLVDGGRGDDDLTANGVIVDPGALGAWVETVEQDSDGDGVVDGMEDGAPNSGDGNQDGTPDRLQPHVASLTQAHTHDLLAQPEDYATLVAAVGTQFRDVEILANPPSEQDPAGLQAAIGFVQFRLENCAPGDAATVTILRDCCPHLQSYWNYGPTADEPEPHWYEFSYDGTTGAEIFDDRIVLHLVDGLRGDADLTADGAVVTNGLPAMPTVNVPPLLNPDVFALDEDGQFAPAVPGLLENDYDFEDDGLTLVKLADPAHGQLTLGNDGSFTYVPDRDFNGLDSFEYQADDGQGGVAGAVVTLIVDPVNDAPVVASPLADVQVLEDAPATVLDLSALFDDVDRATNGDTLTLTLAGNTNPSLLAATVDNARLTLTYLADQSGTAEVTVRAMDAGGLWCEETLTVTVIDVAETWQNPDNPFDVNGRDGVTPLDVLLLVNYINAHPSDASLPAPPALPPPYYDVNNDNSCTPLDVLLVINYINSHPSGSGESEPLNTDYDEEQLGDVLNEIAADVDDAWGLLGFAGDVHHGWHREHGGQSR